MTEYFNHQYQKQNHHNEVKRYYYPSNYSCLQNCDLKSKLSLGNKIRRVISFTRIMWHRFHSVIMVPILAVLYSLNSPIQAYAFSFTPDVCSQYNLGKNWYCESSPESEDSISASDILSSPLSPYDKAIKLNELWEHQRKTAVISERREDDLKFLETQFLIAQKGIDFSRRLQKITDSNPRFANNQSYYQNLSTQLIQDAEREAILNTANKRYGLVFIYNSNCPYCLRQLPIIQRFKKRYGIKVLGISIDGKHYESLDEKINDLSIVQDDSIQAFPTLLLLDKQKPAKIFISRGLITLDDLEEKVASRIIEREEENAQTN